MYNKAWAVRAMFIIIQAYIIMVFLYSPVTIFNIVLYILYGVLWQALSWSD